MKFSKQLKRLCCVLYYWNAVVVLLGVIQMVEASPWTFQDSTYNGTIDIGFIGGVEGTDGNYSSNATLGQTLAGVSFSDGNYSGDLGFVMTIDILRPDIENFSTTSGSISSGSTVILGADCADDYYGINFVTFEISNPLGSGFTRNATLKSGTTNTYTYDLFLDRQGMWTFSNVLCVNNDGLGRTTTTGISVEAIGAFSQNVGQTAVGGGAGGGGGESSPSSYKSTYKISSAAGDWTVSTLNGVKEYSLFLGSNDKISKGRAALVVENVGETTITFTLLCDGLGSTDPLIKDPCEKVIMEKTGFTLIPKQTEFVDIGFTTGDVKDDILYSFNIVVQDNKKGAQAVGYLITIDNFGAFLKRYFLSFILGLIAGLITYWKTEDLDTIPRTSLSIAVIIAVTLAGGFIISVI